MPRELIVCARQTNASPPPDDTHAYGGPDLFRYQQVERILISCTFTWDRARARQLQSEWQAAYPGAEVIVGGPAFGDPGEEFEPGRFLAPGYTITTRGCPGCDHACLVPEREGPLRCLDIKPGHEIVDNNLLAAPMAHVSAVLDMLEAQPRAAKFSGGLDSRWLYGWVIERLQYMPVAKDGLWLAYDAPSQTNRTLNAIERLWVAGFRRDKIRCYVLVGKDPDDTPAFAERRCQDVYGAGAMPFAMLWRGEGAATRNEWVWSHFVKAWRRPAIVKARAEADWPEIR